MNRFVAFLVVVLSVAVFSTASILAQSKNRETPVILETSVQGSVKWEYKVVSLSEGLESELMAMGLVQVGRLAGAEVDQDLVKGATAFLKAFENKLTKLGEDGWELVSLGEQLMAVFKRRK